MKKVNLFAILPQLVLLIIGLFFVGYVAVFLVMLFGGISLGIFNYLPFLRHNYSLGIFVASVVLDLALLSLICFPLFRSKVSDLVKSIMLGFVLIYFYFTLIGPVASMFANRWMMAIGGSLTLLGIMVGLIAYFNYKAMSWHYYAASVAVLIVAITSIISRSGVLL